jgi:tRNA threonylcarbamoyladenosine biosynthesis protein TsaE
VRVLAGSETDTEALGGRLARSRATDGELAVLFLQGGLGAGKTTLARGFLRALGVTAAVRSPTYTLVELYAVGDLTVVHADLYRLQHPDELEALGLRDWARPLHVWLIEWPERGAGHLPAADLTLSLSVASPAHTIELAPGSAAGQGWLQRLERT